MTQSLLYRKEIPVNQYIKVVIPTVGEVVDAEDSYYNIVSALTSMPIDYMVQLDDIGIDFTSINEYELFLILFSGIKNEDTHLIFGDLNLSDFEAMIDKQSGNIVLLDEKRGIKIDRAIYGIISDILCKIHHIKKDVRKPANKEAREYLIKRAKAKMKHNKNKISVSYLESLIVALVNVEQYKYNFEETKKLTIYQFNECVHQIISKIDYDNIMHGIYAGTINAKDLNPDNLNWLVHK